MPGTEARLDTLALPEEDRTTRVAWCTGEARIFSGGLSCSPPPAGSAFSVVASGFGFLTLCFSFFSLGFTTGVEGPEAEAEDEGRCVGAIFEGRNCFEDTGAEAEDDRCRVIEAVLAAEAEGGLGREEVAEDLKSAIV